MATFATFIRIPVSTVLGAASMTGVIASGIILVLTKKYQQKLKKVMCLIDIVTRALVVFERVVSGSLNNKSTGLFPPGAALGGCFPPHM